jgi:multisubunit Na+/H+ antiporter MnhG subunit
MSRPSAHTTYFVMMGTCIALIVVAWNVVRFWSIPVAVGMSVVAALIPPVAAMLAGRGRGGG